MVVAVERRTEERVGINFSEIDFDAVIASGRPCIFRAAMANSLVVKAAQISDQSAMSFLVDTYNHSPLLTYTLESGQDRRFFYTPEMDGLNFTTSYRLLPEFYDLLATAEDTGAAYYIGAADVAAHFPTLLSAAALEAPSPTLGRFAPQVGIWMGNQTIAATHFDVSNNVAACIAGKRQFTLFPPDQISNLYPGPLEPTPGGQVISMVDLHAPDFAAYPNIRQALEVAEVALLSPGDVLVYPAMWWHHVEAMNSFNVLINYWWNEVPSQIDDPMNALLQGLLSLRDRPMAEKDAWRAVFDHYVFGEPERAGAHLPQHARGPLGPLDPMMARRLRARILQRLNR